MARFSSAVGGPANIHVVQPEEFFIMAAEYNGMIIQYNANSYNNLGIGKTASGYAVPAGTVITINTLAGGQCFLNLEDSSIEVWGAGFNTAYQYWYFPENTIGTLTKLDDADTWIISGPSLAQD